MVETVVVKRLVILINIYPWYNTVERGGFSVVSVCLFVGLFINTITFEWLNVRWRNLLGLVYCTKISADFKFQGHSPPSGSHPQKCGTLITMQNVNKVTVGMA